MVFVERFRWYVISYINRLSNVDNGSIQYSNYFEWSKSDLII
ncbi:MAG: hypothetical protein CM15mV27_1450 [Caudoviricetes sp.]|nr:MAG: hypothetical protein CM15mV27_1450 [Caudoviricetes sp.]